jgi:hypothetical protein
MWNRACPICFARINRFLVLTYSYDITCPTCHSPLELSRQSRLLDSLIGFLVALQVFQLPLPPSGANWVLRLVATVLAFCFASALLLFFAADIVVRPSPLSTPFPHPHS